MRDPPRRAVDQWRGNKLVVQRVSEHFVKVVGSHVLYVMLSRSNFS